MFVTYIHHKLFPQETSYHLTALGIDHTDVEMHSLGPTTALLRKPLSWESFSIPTHLGSQSQTLLFNVVEISGFSRFVVSSRDLA